MKDSPDIRYNIWNDNSENWVMANKKRKQEIPDMGFLEYKHNVLNPVGKLYGVVHENLETIKSLGKEGPVVFAFDLDTDNPVKVTIEVEKYVEGVVRERTPKHIEDQVMKNLRAKMNRRKF